MPSLLKKPQATSRKPQAASHKGRLRVAKPQGRLLRGRLSASGFRLPRIDKNEVIARSDSDEAIPKMHSQRTTRLLRLRLAMTKQTRETK